MQPASSPPPASGQHPPHIPPSVVLMTVGAVACFSITETIIKYLTQTYPVPFLTWCRFLVQASVVAALFAPRMGRDLLRTSQFGLQFLRAVLLVISSLFFFSALRWLPLADATAISYCTPVVVIVLSVLLLKERMTRPRWAFVVAGVLGMLLIVRPGASILHGAAGFALAAAACYAVFQILTRKLRAEDPRVTLFFPALCGTLLVLPILLFVDLPARVEWTHVALLLTMGVTGTTGHFLLIRAFLRAPASAVTPFTYSQLVWSVLLGWIVFNQLPDRYTVAGIGIIAASGLLLAWHERRRALALVVPREPAGID